jgi:hypothetical protein
LPTDVVTDRVHERLTIVPEVVLNAHGHHDLDFDAKALLHACTSASPSFPRPG